ncbi:MAG TPA: PIG-L family deacetylase [Anaerolineales bacterium]|nr:PIG-L family deacetylase [Anaerolineales bacterium]
MRWIYLSPHLDDAVLSAGGLIFEQTRSGIPVEIWTFMCGYPPAGDFSPFAELLHKLWGFSSAEETVRERREEDRRAAAVVGAQVNHFDFLDCIYRRGSNGEWLYSDISLPPHPEDADIPDRIAETINAHLQPDDVLVCQLAVGSHVDHVLVRQGAERVGRSLVYDIDIPYFLTKPEEFAPKSAGMSETLYPVTESGLKSWQEAVLEYKSQLAVLGDAMSTPEKACDSIRAYWAQQQGIRLLQKD